MEHPDISLTASSSTPVALYWMMDGWVGGGGLVNPISFFFHCCQCSQCCTVTGFSTDCWCDILLVIFASTPVSSATLRKICEMNKPCVNTASEAACFQPHRYKYDECDLMAAQRMRGIWSGSASSCQVSLLSLIRLESSMETFSTSYRRPPLHYFFSVRGIHPQRLWV